jgi:class 3 adenylate cyclase/tetratricopeptide (TPR) repeat protein
MRTCPSCEREVDGEFAFCPHCGAVLATTRQREQRKTVTVVFCDVTGSTSLGESVDVEALSSLLGRYFERMKSIVERHGGTVEKFIGDAVMAAFGVPLAHEDDALRAVRAAEEMRDALPDLQIQARIGVNTGEVVTGTNQMLATGDAVNVAARLEQAAAPGEVLIGELTLALVRDAVDVEPMEPLSLKGKAEPVPAFRLLRVREASEHRHGLMFVGRGAELATLRQASERASSDRCCELVTIVGDAGVGKSRLVGEFLSQGGMAVARGRCLPYGEGITYSPVADVVRQLDVMPQEPAAVEAIRSLLGWSDATSSADEIAWAVRKTMERSATDRLLVVVFDDLQWGEDTFLDLIDHVAHLSKDAPILLLGMARPELLERRAAWPVTVRLGSLSDEDVMRIIGDRVSERVRAKIAHVAAGNPLFVQEMLAMTDDADGEVIVPPSLQALLAARLDQLDHDHRLALEIGAVEGEVFHPAAVRAIAPEDIDIGPLLAALVDNGLIEPSEQHLFGGDAFRFHHLLIRDVAYGSMRKATRAELHRRFATWLEQRGAEPVEIDEVVGYHYEQAHRYRAELGMPTDDQLAAVARDRLTAAGRRAYLRGDHHAAIGLLGRAAALLPPAEIALLLEITLSDALNEVGRGAEAVALAGSIAERSSRAGDRVAELCARIQADVFRLSLEPEGVADGLHALVEESLPVFEAKGDDLPLRVAYYALGYVEAMRGRMGPMTDAFDRAAAHATAIGSSPHLDGWRASGRVEGPTPVPEALAWLDEQDGPGSPSRHLHMFRAHALAMLGRFDEARRLLREARAELLDRGGGIELGAMLGLHWVEVERLSGDPIATADVGIEGCRLLDELGEHGYQSTAAGYVAQALYALDRIDEADTWARRAAELGASDDIFTQMLWRQAQAKIVAGQGHDAEAERLAREAVGLAEQTDAIDAQGWAHADLGEVLAIVGRLDDAAEELEEAIARFVQKGNVVLAERTRDRLSVLREEAQA